MAETTIRARIRRRPASPARSPRPTASLSPTARAPRPTASLPPSRLRSPPVRITSKVSGVAKPSHGPNDPPRPPSASSAVSPPTSPPIANARPVFYPITTATPAANPHRYAPSRPSAKRLGSPFGSLKVDPNTPPLSPPISAISISSRSSTSHKTDSLATKDGSTSPEYSPSEDDNSDEHKVKAAAKSNRKIADLEITNRSLMVINASLETAKNKQAQEIRELRRKLRESRLILPPCAYRAVKSSLDHDDTDDEEDGNDDDDDSDDVEETDQVFIRLKATLEALLESGRRALETKVADLGGAGSAAKVLSADQVRSWRYSLADDEPEPDQPLGDPCQIAVPDDDDDTPLDDEDMISHRSVNSLSPPTPPILVTPSQEPYPLLSMHFSLRNSFHPARP